MKLLDFLLINSLLLAFPLSGEVVEYTLEMEQKEMAPAGKAVRALTINGSIPGPVLRFKEGDSARITVVNKLPRGEVSTHWHGLLLPNVEDGVPYVTTPPIRPGQSRVFEFPLKQSGTYWYHSHSGFQEQQGIYGAIVIEPKTAQPKKADHDVVVVLSDWTNENPDTVMRNLMRGSDWYSIRKGTKQSIFGAIKAGHLKDYLTREKARLPAMDISDVAYDAFLVNGKPKIAIPAKPGQSIRLRVINAAASTYFYLNSATGPLTIVAADGLDVRPIQQKSLLIGMAETYDLIVTVPGSGQWEWRATSQDGSGKASVMIGSGALHPAPDIPSLNPYDMNASLESVLDQLDETGSPTNAEALSSELPRPLPPYHRLKSVNSTTLPQEAPVRRITLRLNGDMMRYLWTINGKTLKEDSTIPVKRGEVLQMELVNDSMMHHPMHLHGHFFRLLGPDGAGDKNAPLKHTVDVPPMSRRVIEFYANEEKDWVFHCHLLYHMHAGMMKVISYDDQGPDHKPALDPKEDPFYFMAEGDLQTHMSHGHLMLMNSRNDLMLQWDLGWGHEMEPERKPHHGGPGKHKMEDHGDEIEYEIDLMWQRYINPQWMVMGGYRFTNTPGEEDAFFLGATYLLPYLVEASISVESSGDLRISLSKNFELTSRLGAYATVSYDTSEDWMWAAGLTYVLTQNFGIITSYDSDHGFGAGFTFRF